jgi:hypothetical protein
MVPRSSVSHTQHFAFLSVKKKDPVPEACTFPRGKPFSPETSEIQIYYKLLLASIFFNLKLLFVVQV